MKIETKAKEFSPKFLEVTMTDCEGFNINEAMGFDEVIEYTGQLIDSLSESFAFLGMDKDEIQDDLRQSNLIN